MKFNNILETIGNTPVIKLNRLFPEAEKLKADIYIKLEKANPGGSIKDRIALAMIEDAIKTHKISQETLIIEPTSGNTGVGLAMVCAQKNLKLLIVMPESMSIERRKLMQAYGAQLELTPREKGMKGAIERAEVIAKEQGNSWIPMQFSNLSNLEIHKKTTAIEIKNDFSRLDYIITGIGTGGHITACAEALKPHYKNLKVYAVEPTDSPVLSGGNPGPHAIQGIGAGFVPEILNVKILDRIVQVSKEEAFSYAQKLAKQEGILAGISTGASLAAVSKVLADTAIEPGSVILTFNYDTGERYLSIEGLY